MWYYLETIPEPRRSMILWKKLTKASSKTVGKNNYKAMDIDLI
jgi:hypothetical protein